MTWDEVWDERLRSAKIHVVPAEPGWAVLYPVRDEDGTVKEFFDQPVVAWRIESSYSDSTREWRSSTSPVGVDFFFDCDYGMILRSPQRRVIIVAEADFDDEVRAISYINDQEASAKVRA